MSELGGSSAETAAPETSARLTHRAALAVLSACVFFAICTEMLPVGLLPQIGDGLGVSSAGAGLLVSLYAVLVAVATLPIAALVERWPRRVVLVALLGAYALSNLIFALAPTYGVALVARAIGGLAHAGFFAVAVAAAVGLVRRDQAGRAVAVVMLGNALALVFGVPLGTSLGAAVGWRWTFGLLVVTMVGLALTVVLVLPAQDAPRAGAGDDAGVWAGIRRPAVLVVAGVVSLLALGHFTLFTFVSPLLLHDGVDRAEVGLVLFGYGCGGLLGLAASAAAVRRGARPALVADICLMAASLALAAVVTSTLGIVAVVVVWGVAFGAFPTLTQTVMLSAAGDATGAATAVTNATSNVGIAGGALLGSQLLEVTDVRTLGWVGAALVAGSLALLVAAPARRRSA